MRIPVIVWVGLGALVLWLVTKKPSPPAGAAQGKISSLSIDGIPMGAHLVAKTPTNNGLTVTVAWTGATKNFQGVGISWKYNFRYVIQQGSTFSFAEESGIITAPYLVAQSTARAMTIPTVAPAGIYSVTVFLQAEGSDATGTPTGVFTDIPGAFFTHLNAISYTTPPTSGPAVPEGAIGSVDVAQAILRQMNR